MPELAAVLRSLLHECTEELRRARIPRARTETLQIWSAVTGAAVSDALLQGDTPVGPERAADFQRAVQRRAAGEPLAHVTGWTGFRHLSLRSDRRALIPRPETEGLVDLLLERMSVGVVADVGTGSGCIALSLALEGAFTGVLAVDSSAEALGLARSNSELVGEPGMVDFVRADLCSAFRPGSLDALVSNPPYLTRGEYDALDESVRGWEPAVALVSGADGLEATRRLLDEGRAVLRPAGWLAIEVDCARAAAAARMASGYGWDDVSLQVDLFGRERYLLARRSDTR